jgi:hypothetical protein
MSDDAKPLSLYDKETEFFQNPELLTKICRHVANGGSLLDMADMSGVQYCDVMRWIRADKDRSAVYDQALQDRGEWSIELALNELHNIIHKLSDYDQEGVPVKAQVRDRIKAVELIGKTKALWAERVENNHVVKLEDLVLASYKDGKKQQA